LARQIHVAGPCWLGVEVSVEDGIGVKVPENVGVAVDTEVDVQVSVGVGVYVEVNVPARQTSPTRIPPQELKYSNRNSSSMLRQNEKTEEIWIERIWQAYLRLDHERRTLHETLRAKTPRKPKTL
jgi:hypothetical protein